jgi:outer membrane cobalamin receptor
MIYRFTFTLLIVLTTSRATTVSGYVRDSVTEKSIPNANVYIRETGEGIASNPYGYFELNLSNGTYTLETSIIGFKTDLREIIIDENITEINIVLQTAILEFSEVHVRGLFTTRLGYESVDVINSDKIKSMDKESVSGVLRDIPGVDVQFAHPNGRNVNVSIRGSSDYKPGGYNNRVLILLDGFPILIPNSGTPDWSSLPLESIKRIEVDNSPASAQYGHNSMGGVINLITDHNGTDNNTILRLSGGANTTGQVSLTHRKKKGEWTYGINTMARSSEGHRFNADDKITRLRTYLRYGDNKGRTYRLSHILSYSDIGHPGFISSTSYRRSERLSQYVQGHGFYPISNGFSMSHSIFFNKFDTHYYDRNDTPEDEKEGGRDYDDLSFGFRSEMIITKWARWIILTGTDIEWSSSEVTVFNPQYESPSQLSIGGFVQSKYSIGDGWSFGTGLRYDYRRYDYRRSDLGSIHQKRLYTNFSPKVNLMYMMQNKRVFTLAYSEGFRAPSLSELYLLHESSYNLTLQGNSSLSPEKVRAVEIMYEHPHSDSWFWSISLFHNQYENMIDFMYNIPVLAVNREGVTGTGGEYQFRWKLADSFNLSGSYVYLDMSDRDGDPILYRSTHHGRLHFNYQTRIISAQLGVHGWTKQIYENFLIHNQCDQNKNNENDDCWIQKGDKIIFPIRELPERIIYELMLSREINTYTGSLRVSNLFDTKYELIQDFPMQGRTWKFTLSKHL